MKVWVTYMVTGKGPVCGEGGILIGARGEGEQAAAGAGKKEISIFIRLSIIWK